RVGAAVAVIGWDIRDELYPGLDPIGRELIVGNTSFRVIGTVAEQGRTLGQDQDNQLWVPISAFRKSWGRRNSMTLFVKARGGVPGVPAAVDEGCAARCPACRGRSRRRAPCCGRCATRRFATTTRSASSPPRTCRSCGGRSR